MTINASVQAEIDRVFDGSRQLLLTINDLERIAALAVQETARDCAEMWNAPGYLSRAKIHDQILERYGIKETT